MISLPIEIFEKKYNHTFWIDPWDNPGTIDNESLIDLEANIFRLKRFPNDPLNFVLKKNLVFNKDYILTLKSIAIHFSQYYRKNSNF